MAGPQADDVREPLLIIGAAGRMGRTLVRASLESGDLRLGAAVDRVGSPYIGRDACELADAVRGGVPVSDDLHKALGHCKVAVDFSHADSVAAHATACAAAGVPLLVGTTGVDPEAEESFAAAARSIPLLVAANTSIGVNLLIELVRQSAAALKAGWDIEIFEAHHRHKRDAPSGTALALGRAAAEGRQMSLDQVARFARQGKDELRRSGEIGFAVQRGGSIVGEHQVAFCGESEVLTLAHSATDRMVFARGALHAAAWLRGRPPGRYHMRDVVA
ncbi:MAG: 4-hydroxy-tetrahydrodipicolinate reductase [Steroidobacteraceae bacterium]